jgi:acyl-CoA dehydrogenase
MTEPHPGAGSDPSMMLTAAKRRGDTWRIEGRKWFITGAGVAKHFILVAKTSDDPRKGLTAFLFDAEQPGWRIVRRIPILGPEEHGGHCELEFDGLEIADENRLMGVGDGLRVTQIRLGTARLTHCMRWLGSAVRAQAIATDYARKRQGFGKPIGAHEGVGFMLADNEIDIHMARLAIWHAAWVLDQGGRASRESSMAKVACSEAVFRVADRCVQILGGLGVTRDTVVERIFRETRSFRIYDGPSEVHRWSLAQRIARNGANW